MEAPGVEPTRGAFVVEQFDVIPAGWGHVAAYGCVQIRGGGAYGEYSYLGNASKISALVGVPSISFASDSTAGNRVDALVPKLRNSLTISRWFTWKHASQEAGGPSRVGLVGLVDSYQACSGCAL